MGWIIDIALALITLTIILVYTSKGFIRSAIGSFKFILAFFIAYLSASAVGSWLSNIYLFDIINSFIYNNFFNMLSQAESQINLNDILDKVPEFAVDFLDAVGFSLKSILSNQGSLIITAENLEAVSSSIAGHISLFISSAIAFLVIFLLSIVCLTVLSFFLDSIFKAPGLKQLNKALGFIFGCICAFINLIVICSVLTLILNILNLSHPDISAELIKEQTIIYKLISNINIFAWLI